MLWFHRFSLHGAFNRTPRCHDGFYVFGTAWHTLRPPHPPARNDCVCSGADVASSRPASTWWGPFQPPVRRRVGRGGGYHSPSGSQRHASVSQRSAKQHVKVRRPDHYSKRRSAGTSLQNPPPPRGRLGCTSLSPLFAKANTFLPAHSSLMRQRGRGRNPIPPRNGLCLTWDAKI